MFNGLSTFVVGFVVGGVVVLGAQKYHVLRAEDGFHLVPKMGATFSETYIDIREYTAADWSEHPEVTAAVVRAGKSELLKGATVDSLFNGVEGLLKSMRH